MHTSCAISGHRAVKKELDTAKLSDFLTAIIEKGYNKFYIGMARGFDILCCEILIKLKKKYQDLKIVACIPCVGQEKYYNFNEKLKYYGCLGHCDEVKILNERYVPGCMQQRNRYMVDNAVALFAYIYKSSGGTYYTVNYAKEKNKQIFYI